MLPLFLIVFKRDPFYLHSYPKETQCVSFETGCMYMILQIITHQAYKVTTLGKILCPGSQVAI